MTTRARLQLPGRSFEFYAALFADGETGDEPVPAIQRLGAEGLDGSRHALDARDWPLVRWTTHAELSTWYGAIVLRDAYRSFIGEVGTPSTTVAGGQTITWKAKRLVDVQAAAPVATVDGWDLKATWIMRYEGGP